MKLKFFNRLAEKIRRPFGNVSREELPAIAEEARTEVAAEAEAIAEAESATAAETELEPALVADDVCVSTSGSCLKQAQRFLFKKGKPIGKPFGRHTEVRIVYVNNFVESFLFFLRLCDQRLLTYRHRGGHLNCTAVFPDGSGHLTFTDKVTCRNKAVVAVLKLEISGMQSQLSEIRFEIKH